MAETSVDFKSASMVIPPMTDPLSKYWHQPYLVDIQISESHAQMTRDVFSKLSDYSNSRPTGAYPGKMWKALYHDDGKPLWYLCWYGDSENPRLVSNHSRIIVILI